MSGRLNSSISPHRSSSQLTGPKPAPKPDPGAKSHKKYDVEAFEKEKGKCQKREKPSTTHRRNFGATIPIRPASSKLQKTMKRSRNQVRSSNREQQWRSHSNAICKQQDTKDQRTTRATATRSNIDAAIPRQFASTRVQKPKNYVDKAGASSVQTLLQNWISAPKQKKYDFEAFWKRILKEKEGANNEKNNWKPTSTCENIALVGDFPQKEKVRDVKTKLSCKTSLENWKLKLRWQPLLWLWLLCQSLLWHSLLCCRHCQWLFAMTITVVTLDAVTITAVTIIAVAVIAVTSKDPQNGSIEVNFLWWYMCKCVQVYIEMCACTMYIRL